LLGLFIPTLAFSGNEFGGGFIVYDNGQYKLFDFLEYKIDKVEITPIKDHGLYFNEVKSLGFNDDITEKITFKLNDIYLRSPEFANHLFDILTKFSWHIVDIEFNRLEDLGESPIDYKKLVLTPSALRNKENDAVYMSREFFNQLDSNHQVGLVFHEVLGQYFESCVEGMHYTTSSSRRINAFLFNPRAPKTFKALKDEMVKARAFACGGHRHSSLKDNVVFEWSDLKFYRPHERIFHFSYEDFRGFQLLNSKCPTIEKDFSKISHQFYLSQKDLADTYENIVSPLFSIEVSKYPDLKIDYPGDLLEVYWSIMTDLSRVLDSCFGEGEQNSGLCVIKPKLTYGLVHTNNSDYDKKKVTLNWISNRKFTQLKNLKSSFDIFTLKVGSAPFVKCAVSNDGLIRAEGALKRIQFKDK